MQDIETPQAQETSGAAKAPPPSSEVSRSENVATVKKAFPRPILTYEAATWTIFLSFTALAIADRFTWNVWPRQTFSIGAGTAGSDRVEGYKPGPWSVKAYDIIARVSGRFAICCFNLLLVTRLRFFEHLLASSTFVNEYLLDCSDIINANVRLHRWNAIALCVVTVLHVWSILMPCVTHGWSAQVIAGNFEYPLSERTPKGFRDANPDTETMSLQVDDVWRIIEMTVMLCILVPISVRWLARKWHIGMPLHQTIMVLYFIDIVRRHSHPHSWVLNTPFFFLWILDKIWQLLWRKSKSPQGVHRIQLGDDYMALFWNSPYSRQIDTVGPDYFLRLHGSSCMEGRHVFTAFHNRLSLHLNDDDDNKNNDWTAGTIIRVFHNPRQPRTGERWPHTQRLQIADEPLQLSVWGPSYGEMSEHVRYALLQQQQQQHSAESSSSSSVVLVGAGSGVGYMLDALQYVLSKKKNHRYCSDGVSLTLLFTTRSPELHEFVHRMVRQLLMENDDANDDNHKMVKVVLALTGSEQPKKKKKKEAAVATATARSTDFDDDDNNNNSDLTRLGRIRFDEYVQPRSVVFCQGGSTLKEIVAKTCREKKARFFGGRGGGV